MTILPSLAIPTLDVPGGDCSRDGYGGAVADSDGNGWVFCACGERHWGRFGAAGLLLITGVSLEQAVEGPLPPDAQVLLQHRARWTHQGGTWGLPGGARDSDEDVVTTALREAWEETGIKPSPAELLGVSRVEHPSWSYTTVLMYTGAAAEPAGSRETEEARWVRVAEVPTLPLHPGLRDAWPTLMGRRVRMLVDVANVMGSRPDGWWRDRALGTQRTIDDIGIVAGRATTPGGALVQMVNAVVEGAGRGARSDDPSVAVVPATQVPGCTTADDYIATRAAPGDVVVTADAEVREIAKRRGARVMGPGGLWDMVAECRQ